MPAGSADSLATRSACDFSAAATRCSSAVLSAASFSIVASWSLMCEASSSTDFTTSVKLPSVVSLDLRSSAETFENSVLMADGAAWASSSISASIAAVNRFSGRSLRLANTLPSWLEAEKARTSVPRLAGLSVTARPTR
ncbi:hypothetical protein D3C81_1884990 [compost metagenome]